MALSDITSFIFKKPKAIFGPEASGGGLVIDASVREVHEASADLTTSEVEDGTNINDNVRLKPLKLTMEGVVSRTPLSIFGSLFTAAASYAAAAAGAGIGIVAAASATVGSTISSALAGGASLSGLVLKSREPKDVYDFLLQLRDIRAPFSVQTGLRTYKNMILTSLRVIRTRDTGGALRFTAVLEQVRFASSLTVRIPESIVSGGAGASAASATNLGKQAAATPSGATQENGSILFNLFGG